MIKYLQNRKKKKRKEHVLLQANQILQAIEENKNFIKQAANYETILNRFNVIFKEIEKLKDLEKRNPEIEELRTKKIESFFLNEKEEYLKNFLVEEVDRTVEKASEEDAASEKTGLADGALATLGEGKPVADAAASLSRKIFKSAVESVTEFKEIYDQRERPKLQDADSWEIFFDFQCFLYSFVTDTVFNSLDQEKGDIFLKMLYGGVIKYLEEGQLQFFHLKKEEIQPEAIAGIGQAFYASLKDELLKYKDTTQDTIFYEFARRIAKKAKKPYDKFYEALSFFLGKEAINSLNVTSILASMDWQSAERSAS